MLSHLIVGDRLRVGRGLHVLLLLLVFRLWLVDVRQHDLVLIAVIGRCCDKAFKMPLVLHFELFRIPCVSDLVALGLKITVLLDERFELSEVLG